MALADCPSCYQEILAPCLSGWHEVAPSATGPFQALFTLHVSEVPEHEFVVKDNDGKILARISAPSDRAWACNDPVLPGRPCKAGEACA